MTIDLSGSGRFGGGLNQSSGFSISFTEISRLLGRYETTEADIAAIASRFPPNRYRKAIDICCGTGRAASQLHKLGYDVTAIDLSSAQIAAAKLDNPGPNYVVGDMAYLPDRDYDLLINIYTSFGYYQTEAEDIAVLSRWRDKLRAGGALVMEVADMEHTRNRIPENGKLERFTGGVHEYLSMDWETRVLSVSYIAGEHEWRGSVRLYERETLVEHVKRAGFSFVEEYGWFDFRPKQTDDCLVLFAT